MPRYAVTATIPISVRTMVEADTPQEAIEEAESRPNIGLCCQCGDDREEDEVWCTSGELDGTPTNVTATEEG